MRNVVKWLAGAVGLAALARLRSRRRAAAAAPAELLVDGDPAVELRRKLAGQRDDERADDETADDEPDSTADPIDLEARRAQVHARAQEAIDVMRDGETGPDGPDGDSVA